MYLGKRKIFNLDKYNRRREECIKSKSEATYTAFSELEELINTKALAEQYFEKSQTWITKKLKAVEIIDNSNSFNLEEYKQLAEAFRHIAKRLNAHADEIDEAKFENKE